MSSYFSSAYISFSHGFTRPQIAFVVKYAAFEVFIQEFLAWVRKAGRGLCLWMVVENSWHSLACLLPFSLLYLVARLLTLHWAHEPRSVFPHSFLTLTHMLHVHISEEARINQLIIQYCNYDL